MTTAHIIPAVAALDAVTGDAHPAVQKIKPISHDVDTAEDELEDMFPAHPTGSNPKRFDRSAGYPYSNGAALMTTDSEPQISKLLAPSRDDLVQEMDYHGNHRIVDQRDGTATIWVGYASAVYYCGFVGCTGYYGEGLYTAQEFAIRASNGWVLTRAEHDVYVSPRTTQDIGLEQVTGGSTAD